MPTRPSDSACPALTLAPKPRSAVYAVLARQEVRSDGVREYEWVFRGRMPLEHVYGKHKRQVDGQGIKRRGASGWPEGLAAGEAADIRRALLLRPLLCKW